MEIKQAPHQTLEEQEIKDIISSLVMQSDLLRDKINQELDVIDNYLYKLKRHFCPEKFQEAKVPMLDLENLMKEGYGNMNLGAPLTMKRGEDVVDDLS